MALLKGIGLTIIVVALGVAIWWFYNFYTVPSNIKNIQSSSDQGAMASQATGTTAISPKDTSDAGLDSDMNSIDVQLKGLDTNN